MTTESRAPDLSEIKDRQQKSWAAGNYAGAATPSSSLASCSARPLTCARSRRSWTSPPATATPPSPPPVASVKGNQETLLWTAILPYGRRRASG